MVWNVRDHLDVLCAIPETEFASAQPWPNAKDTLTFDPVANSAKDAMIRGLNY